jgi:hypothetical protein
MMVLLQVYIDLELSGVELLKDLWSLKFASVKRTTALLRVVLS